MDKREVQLNLNGPGNWDRAQNENEGKGGVYNVFGLKLRI